MKIEEALARPLVAVGPRDFARRWLSGPFSPGR